jgi:glutamate synthase domain-containing protein 2
VKLISAGKIATGFQLLRHLAIGADLCNSARGMMFAIGCIQALKCNTNACPAGVATQDPRLTRGLVVHDKAERVARFHEKTIEAVIELCGAAGLDSPADLAPRHVFRRVNPAEVHCLADIYPQLGDGDFLKGEALPAWQAEWEAARTDRFGA